MLPFIATAAETTVEIAESGGYGNYVFTALLLGFLGILVYSRTAGKQSEKGPNRSRSHPTDFNNQSVMIDNKPECRGSWESKPPEYKEASESPFDHLKSIYDILQTGNKTSNNGNCLGTRTGPTKKYEWLTYQDIIDKCTQFGSGLIAKGLEPGNYTRVGIHSKNRYEWIVSSYGLHFYSMTSVPMYDSLGMEAIKHIINQTEMTLVVTESEETASKLVENSKSMHHLKTLVLLNPVSEELKKKAATNGIEICTFDEILELGKQKPQELKVGCQSDVLTIVYTSGTTGMPKGTILTVDCVIEMVKALDSHLKTGNVHFGPYDVHISYLPLAHCYDYEMHLLMFMNGAKIGYWSGDVKTLSDDLVTLRPTVFASAPRLFNRMYDGAFNAVKDSWIKTKALKMALASKKEDISKGIYRKDTFWDKYIFKKIQNKLGGRVRFMVSGSAPLSEKVIDFLRCSMGCVVVEAYGQTEASAGLTCTLPHDTSVGHVGVPFKGVQIKLVDVPEMGFLVSKNSGEICAKSSYLFKGYFKDPEKTAETLDQDGWLHTGDIGTWLPNGCLKIIDRKKHIFKLSQGEYLAPEKIEVIYMQSPFVLQCFVNGDSTKDRPVGVVVPDEEYVSAWAKKNGFPSSMKEICQNKEFKKIIMNKMKEQGTEGGLKGYEQVQDILMESTPWSAQNELLTPTFKNKRPNLKAKYWERMQKLYV